MCVEGGGVEEGEGWRKGVRERGKKRKREREREALCCWGEREFVG